MVFMVGVDFALVGLVIATTVWLLAKRFLKGRGRTIGTDVLAAREELEFGYCFDVHCNAFFPVFVWLYVVQYLIMPLLMKDLWYDTPGGSELMRCVCRISLFLGNTLYAVALLYYSYITFLGYSCMFPLSEIMVDFFSVTVLAWDEVAVDSDSCDTGVVYY